MNTAIIYSSRTGNTELLAQVFKEEIKGEELVCCQKVGEELPDAQLYLIGSWTDKGNAAADILECLEKLKGKKIAYFGTAGYGEDEAYYEKLFQRVKEHIDASNEILGYFFCQGKMPVQVRERYRKMLEQNPEDMRVKESIRNFNAALPHPDKKDLERAREWVRTIL